MKNVVLFIYKITFFIYRNVNKALPLELIKREV
jgi:hypothetical protein